MLHDYDILFSLCLYRPLKRCSPFPNFPLCVVYRSLMQCLPLVYPWARNLRVFFFGLVTTRRLQGCTVVGFCSTGSPTITHSQGPLKYTRIRDYRKVPCRYLPGGHIQGHRGAFTIVDSSKGPCVVPHLPCTCQPVSFRST